MSIIRFGVTKPVPVNLLMTAILLGGIVAGLSMRREFFPESDPDMATISMPYPGASPDEIEQTLALKVEDKLAELDEIKEIRTTLSEGGGGITVEFREGVDTDDAIDEIERAIDSLRDLPEESEQIQVQLFEPRLPVIRVILYGELEEKVMKRAIRHVRDDLRTLPGMGEVLLTGTREYEIHVDVRPEAMLEQRLSLPQIADTIRQWMSDVPGGTVRSESGNIKVRTMGVEERDKAIGEIVVKADPSGRTVRVRDIATIQESFVDTRIINRFNGQPAVGLILFKVGDQDIVNMAEMVRAYIQGRNGETFSGSILDQALNPNKLKAWQLGRHSPYALPAGAKLAPTSDLARFVEGRLDLLLRNAKYGAVLVFLTLLVFLNWRVSVWVGVGLLTAMAGTLLLMFVLDVTLNLLTMFGLIVVLGLLVDDAIVVSENIQTLNDRGEPSLRAAIDGANQVLWPVVATVLTSVVAFLPLRFIRGQIGDLLGALPLVIACALLMSLVESLLILPSHMGHSLAKRGKSNPGRFVTKVRKVEKWRDHLVLERLVPGYAKLLAFLLKNRYPMVAGTFAMLIISLGLVAGGQAGYAFLSKTDAETIVIDVRLPVGASVTYTNEVVKRIEEAAQAQPETLSVGTTIGEMANIDTGAVDANADHIAQIFVELYAVEERTRESSQVVDSIRRMLEGKIDEVDRISFTEITGGPGGADISIELKGDDDDKLELAANRVKKTLGEFDGVFDVADDTDRGQIELQINLKPGAAALGFSVFDVARQIRGALYGLEAHVFADRNEDIEVRVRLDRQTRGNLHAIENSWVISPQGKPVPLSEIADIRQAASYASIKRMNRQRTVTVTASTAANISPEAIVRQFQEPLKEIQKAFPLVSIEFGGRQERERDAFKSLPYGFMAAIVMIYVILAWLFSSYLQPVVVISVVPFSLIGVIWGHMLLGYEITFLSLIGFVALSGIVVNDSLILVKFYNEMRLQGAAVESALVAAGRARLRAILLTTMTTVLGLTPLILERSFQAKFLIPMAISLAVGLLSATVVVLIVLPCAILIFDDFKRAAYFLWHGRKRPAHTPQHVVIPERGD